LIFVIKVFYGKTAHISEGAVVFLKDKIISDQTVRGSLVIKVVGTLNKFVILQTAASLSAVGIKTHLLLRQSRM
jgi:hypothetical protein